MKPQSAIPGRFVLTAVVALCAGCPQYRDPTVPNPIRNVEEPTSGRHYLIYEPSRYDAAKAHPLVVVCHGTRPFDYPLRQIRDWVKLAEEKGFLVVAPFLEGTTASLFRPVREQIRLQRDDEKHILNVVRHVSGGHNVSQDRIFLTGWSAGNYAVLHTGLRHPELFRALAVLQGNFDPTYVADVVDSIDPYQPVFVLYGADDVLTGKQGRQCVEWLGSHRVSVVESQIVGTHRGHPKEACEFFQHVVRTVPWLHIRVFQDGSDRLSVRFKIRASFEPAAYAWSFGDGETSPVAEPDHTYTRPGTCRVTLDARMPTGKTVRRTVDVVVPQARRSTSEGS